MKPGAAKRVDTGRTMREMWEGYADGVLTGVGPGTVQYEETRKGFYAGALCLFNWFMVQLDEGAEPTDADLGRVSAMNREIRDFFEKGARQ